MTTSEQLEIEAEETRVQIASTLDELRSRITPGQLLDQALDYARDRGGGAFLHNLGRDVVDNPIPVALVGSGVAWLAIAGRRSPGGSAGAPETAAASAQDAVSAARESADQTARDWAARTGSVASDLGDRAGEMGMRVRDAAGGAMSALGDTASSAYAATAGTSQRTTDVIGNTAAAVRSNAAAGGQNIMDFFQEQPLVLAGLGLALGAVLGAALPRTDVEDRLMGEASDHAKDETAALAKQQLDKGKAVAEQAWDAARPEAERQTPARADDTGADRQREERDREGTRDHASSEAPLVPSDEHGREEASGDDASRGDVRRPAG
jgi:Protein of unknown function (DUF3618)